MKTNHFIEEVPQDSLPRERLLNYGEKALSNQELLAILLRTGSKDQNVMELAGQFLKQFPDLYTLKMASLEELQAIHGIGRVRSIELRAAIELGCRIEKATQPKFGQISSSNQIAHQLIQELRDFQQEHLVALYLNTKNEIIKQETIFIGSLNQSIAHPREIFKGAVRYSAARVLIAHNHPSGNPQPSENDLDFTERVKYCGEMMGIPLLDHIITGHDDYLSMKEEGLI